MKKNLISILVLALVLIPLGLAAKPFGKVGTAGMQFLKLGVDARAIGMGEAYTAVSDDISSVYWNPAGLAPAFQNQVFFSHTNWPASIMQEFVAGTYTTGVSTFAIYGSVLHMDDMEETDEETFEHNGGYFTNSGLAFGINYAQQFTDKFSAGGGIKYLRENLYEFSAHNYAFDLGSKYNTGWKNITIGMALKNFGPDFRYRVDDDGDGKIDEDPYDLFDNDGDGLIDEDGPELEVKIPMHFSLGVAGDLYRTDSSYWIVSLQLDNVIDRTETWNLGTEYKLGNLFLRGGYQFNFDTNGYSAGAGWQVPTRLGIFNIDYAYTDMDKLTENFIKGAHRVSLKMRY
ncbi:MAG: PorV/PorQ family protein [Candidatus Cloacimonetes bacterium]|nr:PorV/PorQ family protein [Candidatus Cloacimonadota bacterium]